VPSSPHNSSILETKAHLGSNLGLGSASVFYWFPSAFTKHITLIVTTLALGSQPRQGLARVRAKKEAQESHLMLPRV